MHAEGLDIPWDLVTQIVFAEQWFPWVRLVIVGVTGYALWRYACGALLP